MIPPVPVIFFLFLLLLFAFALIIHLNVSAVSLPLEPLTIATIFYPITAGLVAYLHSSLTTGALQSAATLPTSAQRRRRRRIVNFARTAAQTLQGTFAVALATLLLQRMAPNQFLDCSLEGAWTRMWREHNANGIKNVEEGLKCCGFRSVLDRPWPFPDKEHPDTNGCVVRLGHDTPCHEPWKAYMQQSAGGAFTIVAVVTLMQVGNILLHAGYFNRRFTPWFSHSRPLILPGNQDPVRRPLLEGGSASANGTSGRIIEEGDDESMPPQGQRNGGSSGISIVGNARSAGLAAGSSGDHQDVEDGWRGATRDGARNGGRRRSKSSSSSSDSD